MAEKGEEFVPRGAIAFFAAMTALFAVVWLAVYALMIHRH
jgi:hypothetical protein